MITPDSVIYILAQDFNIDIGDENDICGLVRGLEKRKNDLQELIHTLERIHGLKPK